LLVDTDGWTDWLRIPVDPVQVAAADLPADVAEVAGGLRRVDPVEAGGDLSGDRLRICVRG
jgi:hypothetical protein